MPGIVQGFYSGPPATADVQPAVHDVRLDTDSGERISEPWPVLAKIPVLFPKFGGYYMAGPMSQGDHVILIALDLDPTVHRLNGNAADPVDVRRHGGQYWIAIPGDITDPGGVTAPSVFTCGHIGGPVIQIDGSKVYLGGTSVTDALALASKVDAIMVLLKTLSTSLATAMGVLATAATPAGPMHSAGPDAGDYTAVGSAATALAAGIATVASSLVKSG